MAILTWAKISETISNGTEKITSSWIGVVKEKRTNSWIKIKLCQQCYNINYNNHSDTETI